MNTHLTNITKHLLCSRHSARGTVLNEKSFLINVQSTRVPRNKGTKTESWPHRPSSFLRYNTEGSLQRCSDGLAWDPRETNPDIPYSDLCFAIIC